MGTFVGVKLTIAITITLVIAGCSLRSDDSSADLAGPSATSGSTQRETVEESSSTSVDPGSDASTSFADSFATVSTGAMPTIAMERAA